ncbi:MAG: PQQ-dependent sugar dehydrogenase, partial [Actinomycetota bacterium]|nr:PQQ-dependent sugar dehydrogenase [Actinomycetota bacterium]
MTRATGVSARTRVGAIASVALALALWSAPGAAGATQLPSGFRDSTVLSGLEIPTAVRFAPPPDGRVFVAEKSGLVKAFDGLSDADGPDVVADLRKQVYNFWDRGLLGLALDPNFATNGYLYVLYARNALPGGTAPEWPSSDPEGTYDECPEPPGAMLDGCTVTGRLSRLELDPITGTAEEKVLIEDWCQQFPSHSVGSLAFGADGALYASGGEGAEFGSPDVGQHGGSPEGDPRVPNNPCGDPPGGVGEKLSPPTAEGGALRSQDLRTSADPVGLSGTLIRVDPATGEGLADNPLADSADANARRIVAHGFRNPFRFAVRPGTSDVWVADVGWGAWEEIDRIPDPTAGPVKNFGWPCYEGASRQKAYEELQLDLCRGLYDAGPGAAAGPSFAYEHGKPAFDGDGCKLGNGSSLSGAAFYPGGSYPARHDGGLFFADYVRGCIYAMPIGSDGLPDPQKVTSFATGVAGPVDLQAGPNGDLFYVDIDFTTFAGSVRRIEYLEGNQPPNVRAEVTPSSGPAPLDVTLDGTGTSDPDGGPLTYAWEWDPNADGVYDALPGATVEKVVHRFEPGYHSVRLRVTDSDGASDTSDPVTVSAGYTPPSITAPAATTRWRVGDRLRLEGSALDEQERPVPDERLSWDVILYHGGHAHPLTRLSGGAPSITAPDHEYPAHLELRLTAKDSAGRRAASERLRLDPRTIELRLATTPEPFEVALNREVGLAPLAQTVIAGSRNSVVASEPAPESGFRFGSWSDGGARAHDVTAPDADTTLIAAYLRPPPEQPRDEVPVRIAGLKVAPRAFRPARGRSGGARVTYA